MTFLLLEDYRGQREIQKKNEYAYKKLEGFFRLKGEGGHVLDQDEELEEVDEKNGS